METKSIDNKLIKLREILIRKKLDVLIVPHSDAHDNEYLASSDERISFISGFKGSNALCLITKDEALCWTDGRYYISCEKELLPGWKMMKMERGELNSRQYIKEKLSSTSIIGIDYSLISNDFFNIFKSQLPDYTFINDSPNSVDELWGEEKPSYLKDKVFIHDVKFSGASCLQKYERVYNTFLKSSSYSKKNEEKKVALIIVKLDDIAWITNLRGQDIEFNPVFFSFAILYHDVEKKDFKLHLFADKNKFNTEEIQSHLSKNNISLYEYDDFYKRLTDYSDISNEPELVKELKQYIRIASSSSINQQLCEILTQKKNEGYNYYIDNEFNFVESTKYIKNDVEIKGFRDCHVRDGAALVRYFAWLENELIREKNTKLTEYDAALKSKEFRKQGKYFIGESFECISSTGANAAIIHYKPTEKECSIIDKNKVYLCDSGAQYLDGTTDTTRTLFFNTDYSDQKENLKKEKEMYTRVLLGNLAIERSSFKKNSKLSGKQFDVLARQYLWQVKEDYMHGTGHGVGHFLNVHEGPNGIGGYPGNPSFEKGVVTSNEPGYYLKDKFGIRIENIIAADECEENKDFLIFENFTMVPYEKNLLDYNLLSNDYIDYINKYHELICAKILPLLNEYEDYTAIEYLKRKTLPIAKFHV